MPNITKDSSEKEVLEAVKTDGMLLQHANSTFQNNKIIVLAALKQNINSLQYASTNLQQDIDVLELIINTTNQDKTSPLDCNFSFFDSTNSQAQNLPTREAPETDDPKSFIAIHCGLD